MFVVPESSKLSAIHFNPSKRFAWLCLPVLHTNQRRGQAGLLHWSHNPLFRAEGGHTYPPPPPPIPSFRPPICPSVSLGTAHWSIRMHPALGYTRPCVQPTPMLGTQLSPHLQSPKVGPKPQTRCICMLPRFRGVHFKLLIASLYFGR